MTLDGLTYRVFHEDGEWVAVVDQPRDWCRHLSCIEGTPHEALRGLVEDVLPVAHDIAFGRGVAGGTIAVEWDGRPLDPSDRTWVARAIAGPYEGEGFAVPAPADPEVARAVTKVAGTMALWLNEREGAS